MALGRTQGGSLMEELGAGGSLQDPMEKGPLFRRGSHCGEWMFLTTELSVKKSAPKPCKSVFGRIFLLLPGHHGFCSGVTEGKISWDISEWLRNEKTLFSVSLGKLLVAGAFLGSSSSSSFSAHPLVLPPEPWGGSLCPSQDWDCSCSRITLCVQLCQTLPWIIIPSCQLSSFGRCVFLFFIIYTYYWLEFKDQSWYWQILSKCDPLHKQALPRASEGDLSRILGLSPLLRELFILSPPCALTLHSLVLLVFLKTQILTL